METKKPSGSSPGRAPENAPTLKKSLGVTSIVFSVLAWAAPLLVVAGQMPTIIAYSQDGVLIGYCIPFVVVLFFSVGYVAITKFVDRPGAFYAYITAGLGKKAGLGGAFIAVFGYAILLISTWLGFGCLLGQSIVEFGGPELPWYVCAFIGIAITAILAIFSVNISAGVLVALMGCEAIIILIFDIAVGFDGGPDGFPTAAFTPEGSFGCNYLGLAALFGTLCFIGFESSTIYREEAKDPEKTIARATYISVIAIGAFYVISSIMMLMALGEDGVNSLQLDEASALFTVLAESFVGQWLSKCVSIFIITSTFAALLAQHNAVSRYAFSFGTDGVLPKFFAKVHARYGSPYMASVVVTILEVLFVLAIMCGTGFDPAGVVAYVLYMRINGLGAMTVIVLMCLVSLAILVYFKTHRTDLSAWKKVIAPVLGLIGLLILLVLSLTNVDMLIGASFGVSLGLCIFIPIVFIAGFGYASSLQKRKPEVYLKIGRQ